MLEEDERLWLRRSENAVKDAPPQKHESNLESQVLAQSEEWKNLQKSIQLGYPT